MKIFTPEERFIILFLIFSIVLGSSLYLYKINHPSFAPAYIIEDFQRKVNQGNLNGEVVNYNLPVPEQKEQEVWKKKETPKSKININTANLRKLMQLPGIGPSYAKKILEYRKKYNGFRKISDIKKIRGIGEKKFETMKDYITTK